MLGKVYVSGMIFCVCQTHLCIYTPRLLPGLYIATFKSRQFSALRAFLPKPGNLGLLSLFAPRPGLEMRQTFRTILFKTQSLIALTLAVLATQRATTEWVSVGNTWYDLFPSLSAFDAGST